MSAYIYKVTGKTTIDNKGRKVNLLAYAYKPYHYDDEANARLERSTGCRNAERYVSTGKTFTGRVAMEEGGASIAHTSGTINDYGFYHIVDRDEKEEQENALVLEEHITDDQKVEEMLSMLKKLNAEQNRNDVTALIEKMEA